jgi:hypothetical protein
MNRIEHLAMRIHRLLIACYPTKFRAKFGKEMQVVFKSNLTEHHSIKRQPWRLIWEEIRDWPGLVIGEHLREWKVKMSEHTGFIENKPLERIDWLAALAIFLIPPFVTLLTMIINNSQQWLGIVVLLLFLVSILAALIIAVIRKLPRWLLPYIGFVVTGAVFIGPFWWLWERIYPTFLRLLGQMNSWSLTSRILYQGIMTEFMWFLVLLAGLILIIVLSFWEPTRIIWQRIREDWTQLSFLIYGGIIIHIFIIFDEYQHDQPWKIAAWFCLAIGCWLYLNSNNLYGRIVFLLIGATSAMWVVATGKWFIIPLQNWPIWFNNHPPETERLFSAGNALAGWVCIVIALLVPSLLKLLPRTQKLS